MINLINRPNPGSDEARKQGCLCPIYDNEFGRGYYGSGEFIVRMDCKLHTMEVEELEEMIGIKDEHTKA